MHTSNFPSLANASHESASTVFLAYFTALEAAAGLMQPFRGAAKTQAEVVKFMSRRAQAILEIPAQLATCRNPHDILSEQMRFWDTAAKEYAETSQHLAAAWNLALTGAPLHEEQDETDTPSATENAHDYIAFPAPKRPRRPVDRTETYAYGFA